MGNNSSQIEKFTDAHLVNFDNFTSIEEKDVQGIFGKCTLFQKKGKSNEFVICKKIQIENEMKQQQIQQYFEQRMQIQHANLLKFYGYSFNKQNSFCSTNYSFNAYYEYHPISLLQENNNRQQNEEIYQLNELWYMAKSLISLCDYLQQNEEVHPNIHPSTIFLTESGQLKLVDSSIMALSTPNCRMNSSSSDHQTQTMHFDQRYISPEEVINMKNLNKFKLSIFQVGMTLLESALIQDCSYIYLEDDSINNNSLDFLINKVQEIYGDSFTNFLKKILQLNPNNRPDSAEIFQSQFKSVSFGDQSQISINRLSEAGDTSPIPRSMRLNSSLVNQAVVSNFQLVQPAANNQLGNGSNSIIHTINNNSNNNTNSSRRNSISGNNSNNNNNILSKHNSQQMTPSQQNNLKNTFNYESNRQNKMPNKDISKVAESIKTPSGATQIKVNYGNHAQFSQQISLQNSPMRTDNQIDKQNLSFSNIYDSKNMYNSQKGMNSSLGNTNHPAMMSSSNNNNNANNNNTTGPFLHNFQSFSNTMNNPHQEHMLSSTFSNGEHNQQGQVPSGHFYSSTALPKKYDLKAHSQIKYIESQVKNPHYSQTPPRIHPADQQEDKGTSVNPQQQKNAQNMQSTTINQSPVKGTSSSQTNIYLINNGYKSNISNQQLSNISGDTKVDSKLYSNLTHSTQNTAPLKDSNIGHSQQQQAFNSKITTIPISNGPEMKQSLTKLNVENPGGGSNASSSNSNNAGTIYKVFYNRGSSVSNQQKQQQEQQRNTSHSEQQQQEVGKKLQTPTVNKSTANTSSTSYQNPAQLNKSSANYYSLSSNTSMPQIQPLTNNPLTSYQPVLYQVQKKNDDKKQMLQQESSHNKSKQIN